MMRYGRSQPTISATAVRFNKPKVFKNSRMPNYGLPGFPYATGSVRRQSILSLVPSRWRDCAAELAGNQVQFSTRRPGTRLNSLTLLVTSRAPRLNAWAAISMSIEPIGRPFFSKRALIFP